MEFLVSSAIIAALYVMVALPFGLTIGRGGTATLSIAAVWGVAAYTFGILHVTSHVGTVWCVLAAIGMSGATNAIVNLPAVSLTAEQFIVGSIAVQLAISAVLSSLGLTGGDAGFVGIIRPGWAINDNKFLIAVGVVVLVLFVLLDRLMRSPFGLSVDAGRDDAVAAAAGRHRAVQRRIELLAVAGLVAGVAGVCFGWYYQVLQPADFSEGVSITIVLMVVIGGSRSTLGPILGAILISGLQSALLDVGLAPSSAGYIQQIIFGLIVMAVMYLRPDGLIAPSSGWYGQARNRRPQLLAVGPGAATPPPGGEDDVLPAPPVFAGRTWVVDADPDETLLRVDDAVVAFGGLKALAGASIAVRRGRIVGLVGPNGAGKTTLFNVVSGVLSPESGRVSYRGQDISHLGVASRASLGIGRSFQGGRLFEDLTLIENVMVGCDWAGTETLVSAAVRRRRARRALGTAAREAAQVMGMLGIPADRFDQLPAESSHGDQMLVGVGRLVAMGCDLILLDEPAAGLDEGAIQRMKSVLTRCSQAGCGVLLVEHNLTLVAELVDELVVLDAGAVIAQGVPADVIRDPRVQEVYVGVSETDLTRGRQGV
jgi:branched-chain amino acid transport system permease protein